MNKDKEYILEFVKHLIDGLDEGTKALIAAGMPSKTAIDIERLIALIPQDEYSDFVDWFYSLLSPDKWRVIDTADRKRVHLEGEANYDRPFTYGGISKCIRGGIRKFADFSLIPARDAEMAGYKGYHEAVALINAILSGNDTYHAWRAFSKASHRYGRKALCATLLAGSDEWEKACSTIMKMPIL